MGDNISKRFPADTQLDILTFLNDKKVDGELYAYLQSMSFPEDGPDGIVHTIVKKENLPPQNQICSIIGVKTAKTYRAHLLYLVESGFVKLFDGEEWGKETGYELPNKEDIFFMIPLKTLQYLNDTVQPLVIKTFIYLGQRWKFKSGYVFSLKELAPHVGEKLEGNTRGYTRLNNALDLLSRLGLISYAEFQDGDKPMKKLTAFSLEIKNHDR